MKKFIKKQNSQTIGEALEFFITQNGKEDLISEVRAEEAWTTVMGKFFEKYTDSVVVRNRVLCVKINSPAMREELHRGRTKIKENINEEIKKDYIIDVKIY